MGFLLLVLLGIGLTVGADSADAGTGTHMVGDRDVIVKMFSWKWTDIAEECERFLGPMGYGGVQIDPPNEHAVISKPFRPWWERYMPVSYRLESRSGTAEELADMVERCNKVGVRTYADIVMNQMANGELGVGSASNVFDSKTLSYPGVPYAAQDFSVHNGKCPSKTGDIESKESLEELRDCNLFGMPDLDTSVQHVRYSVARYMNRLIGMGLAGFLMSNADNIWPADLAGVYRFLDDLSPDFFEKGSRPFIYQEVRQDKIVGEYSSIGSVLDHAYGRAVIGALRRPTATPFSPSRWRSGDAGPAGVVFVDNPGTERSSYPAVDFREPRLFAAANLLMLAFPRGAAARVTSSYTFADFEDGPPAGADGKILSPTVEGKWLCANGWVCEHRWREIRNMLGFRRAAAGRPLRNWWSGDGHRQMAFGLGDRAFLVLNPGRDGLARRLRTGLPAGVYCDIAGGDFDASGGSCTGGTVAVDGRGFASFALGPDGPPAVAIHVDARLPAEEEGIKNDGVEKMVGEVVEEEEEEVKEEEVEEDAASSGKESASKPSSSHGPSGEVPSEVESAPNHSTMRRTLIFIKAETAFGQSVFVRGGCIQRDFAEPCTIPIAHLPHGANAQYNAWSAGDNYLDWNEVEEGQGTYQNAYAEGTPLVWTTNDTESPAEVSVEGHGHTPLNLWGSHYWMADLMMDCGRTDSGWFELKGFVKDGQGWEEDVTQEAECRGSAGGSRPGNGSINHFGRCGFVNVFELNRNGCIIDNFDEEGEVEEEEEDKEEEEDEGLEEELEEVEVEKELEEVEVEEREEKEEEEEVVMMASPADPFIEKANPASGDGAPQYSRTVIFVQKETVFGQQMFIRGGLDHGHHVRSGCTHDSATSACALPIQHRTPGRQNAGYDAWKSGDDHLDWYGAESGQGSYRGQEAAGTPMVWTTSDPADGDRVDVQGYGYAELNRFGPHFWMVDLGMDCSRTARGWFELRAVLTGGPSAAWEASIDQAAPCLGSAGGSRPYQTHNHFARCGYLNVFTFDRDNCTIEYLPGTPSRK